jgi:hypothetical protein
VANLRTGSNAYGHSLHPRQDVGPRQHGQVRISLSFLLSLVGSVKLIVLGHLVHLIVLSRCVLTTVFHF